MFCKALANVFSRPPAISWGSTENDQFIQASDLAAAVEIGVGEDLHVDHTGSGPGITNRIKGKDWLDTDGHICPRLASYAAASGVLDTLVADAGLPGCG